MIPGLGVTFLSPWILLGLAALPVLWWLMRITPPRPRQITFPPLSLLRALHAKEQTPARTPWWVLLIRISLVGLVILALASPILNARPQASGQGPIVVVLDDGWAAAPGWSDRQARLLEIADQAERTGRAIYFMPTAATPEGEPANRSQERSPADLRQIARELTPKPWPTDRSAVLDGLASIDATGGVWSYWLTDGLADAGATTLLLALRRLGGLTVFVPGADQQAVGIIDYAADPQGVTVTLERPMQEGPNVKVEAFAADGASIAQGDATFAPASYTTQATLDLPLDLRNQIVRLAVTSMPSAGGSVLLDDRWQRRRIGIAGIPGESLQPLLNDTFYLTRALSPYAELHVGSIGDVLAKDPSLIVLPDVGRLDPGIGNQVTDWVNSGGVLVRFAGSQGLESDDPLLPVRLRGAERRLGGALTWDRPAKPAPFTESSPFAGLEIPDDVTVRRQVLAIPDPDLATRSWARLEDGTPLVTGAARGQGWTVLFHVNAHPDWSTLPISGLFVQMLQRLTDLAGGRSDARAVGIEAPIQVLDWRGQLIEPPIDARPLPSRGDAVLERALLAGPEARPGFYGTPTVRRAVNLAGSTLATAGLPAMPAGVTVEPMQRPPETSLQGPLLVAALILFFVDWIVSFRLRGALRFRKSSLAGALALLVVSLADGRAGIADPHNPEWLAQVGSNNMWLAYIETGDDEKDDRTKAGLDGLSFVLAVRTAIEAEGAIGLDPEADELAFFPMLYWAVDEESPALSSLALDRLNAYLRHGGTLMIDTGTGTLDPAVLRRMTAGLDIPPLVPVAADHVLRKAFYLLDEFPGRYASGSLWVAVPPEGGLSEGVSPVIIGANDYAGAWAVDSLNRPMFATVPADPRQRELAYRFGVNLMMYALTGNYKADQVHVPFILERLGQ